MGPHNKKRRGLSAALLMGVVLGAFLPDGSADPLSEGFWNPPTEARIRAYWWWLNGNVTKASITRDLEQMAAKGFGGALICDAGGAEQRGNNRVPHGPTFFSPEWRELYRHTLREAARLGLEMSLNIQSGWNLGGPMVSAEDAPKKLVWTETRVQGPATIRLKLDEPEHPPEFYRDVAVLAYPRRTARTQAKLRASSAQPGHPAVLSADGNEESFWVSGSADPGDGPTEHRPEWLQVDLPSPGEVNRLRIQPRNGYGPREVGLQVSDDGLVWQNVKKFSMRNGQVSEMRLESVKSTHFRVLFSDAFDPSHPAAPRNVQVAELQMSGPDGVLIGGGSSLSRPLQNWQEKAMLKALHFSAPDTTPLLVEQASQPGEADTRAAEVVELTAKLEADGTLRWEVPEGFWEILRFGCTLNDHCRVSTQSDGWSGYALDPFDAGAFGRYWDAVVEPLIADAGPLAGNTLKYLHTDSWEVEVANWTPTLREEFLARRGYDLLPYLPVIAGRIVNSREESNRYLHDFRRTMGDLAIDNHYRLFRDGAHRHDLLIHPESGGPHAVPIDAQQCLGFNDAPMSEFWAWSWQHRIGDENRFFVKQPASAAHVYGHRFVLAEGFTTIGPHWQERLWDNLKPSFDHACTEGMNRLVWHAFVCSPESEGIPGQQYFAGTHLNPLVTWWETSAPFFTYLNRCQYLLQQGLFVADAAYYYGNHVPNFTQLRDSDPAGLGTGYDYDVFTEEVLLTRAAVQDGRIVLPDGMSYRVLVLPDRTAISLPALRKLKELVQAGATIIGPRPETAVSLTGHPQCDVEVRELADHLWEGGKDGAMRQHRLGEGRVISGSTAREVLLADGVEPDFEFTGGQGVSLDYIHRRDGGTEIYFLSNRSNTSATADCTFRVSGLAPELWNAVTGERAFAVASNERNGRIVVPLEFDPCGSWFVLFRQPATGHGPIAESNTRKFKALHELTGAWTVKFDPDWGGPESVEFDSLTDWTRRREPGIKFYSGTAVYTKTFDLPDSTLRTPHSELFLDLGDVREMAEITLNGKPLGVVWTPPFRVEITDAVKGSGNLLEIDVVNFWPNRIIGDASLPQELRLTRTNVRQLKADTSLMKSGLLGPVRLVESQTSATALARAGSSK